MTVTTDQDAWRRVVDLAFAGKADHAALEAKSLGVRAWRTFLLISGVSIHLWHDRGDAELVIGLQGGCFVDIGSGAKYCHTPDEAAVMLASWAGPIDRTEQLMVIQQMGYIESILDALATSPQAGAQALRAAGVKCVWEDNQIVLYEALVRLERLEDGQWQGWYLMAGAEDEPPKTGDDLRDVLLFAVPYC